MSDGYGEGLTSGREIDPRILRVRNKLNIPELKALTDDAIEEALRTAEVDVARDSTIDLSGVPDYLEEAVIAYAVYEALKTYCSRGRHVSSGHLDEMKRWVSDAPQGLFDFREALSASEKAMTAWKEKIGPAIGIGVIRRH